MFSIFYGFIWLITWLPLRVLYLFSDLFYLIIYYIVPYRKKLTRENLKNAFPEKSKKELRKIERRFYRFFCDLFIETIYQVHMSEAEVRRRFDLGNIDLITQQYALGKSVLNMTAHYGNWEWGSSLSLLLPPESPMQNVYKKLSNKKFDKLMSNLRSKYKGQNIEAQDLMRSMIRLRNENKISTFAMISDQSPFLFHIHHWMTFLNQETPVIIGTEQLAKKFDYPVIYTHVIRVKRGYYRCEYYPVSLNPKATADYEITETYMRILEEKINERPEYWLWTHKRWKHKRVSITTVRNRS